MSDTTTSIAAITERLAWSLASGYLRLRHQARAAGTWYGDTFFRRKEGQTFFEYIILVALAIMVAAAAYGLYQAIQAKFVAATDEINSIPTQ